MTIICRWCNNMGLAESKYEPEFFGDSDYERCDECGRWVCMACAVFDFGTNEQGVMRYLCPDCGEPEHVVMRRLGATPLLEVI